MKKSAGVTFVKFIVDAYEVHPISRNAFRREIGRLFAGFGEVVLVNEKQDENETDIYIRHSFKRRLARSWNIFHC
jgi:hypothetical protein